jgi:hypothetical protein
MHYEQERFCDGLATNDVGLMLNAVDGMAMSLCGYSYSYNAFHKEFLRACLGLSLQAVVCGRSGLACVSMPFNRLDSVKIELLRFDTTHYEVRMTPRSSCETSGLTAQWERKDFTLRWIAVTFDRSAPFVRALSSHSRPLPAILRRFLAMVYLFYLLCREKALESKVKVATRN